MKGLRGRCRDPSQLNQQIIDDVNSLAATVLVVILYVDAAASLQVTVYLGGSPATVTP